MIVHKLIFLTLAILTLAFAQTELECDNCRAAMFLDDPQPSSLELNASVAFVRPAPFSIYVRVEMAADGPFKTEPVLLYLVYQKADFSVSRVYIPGDEHTIVDGVLEGRIRYEVPSRIGYPEAEFEDTGIFFISLNLRNYLVNPRDLATLKYNATIMETPPPIFVSDFEVSADMP